MRNPNILYYRVGAENKEYWDLFAKLKDSMEMIESESNGFYTVYSASYDGDNYKITEDIENGIAYSIEKLV
jgi:hypothetical protein